jgi:hypothetical protein
VLFLLANCDKICYVEILWQSFSSLCVGAEYVNVSDVVKSRLIAEPCHLILSDQLIATSKLRPANGDPVLASQ